MILENSSGIRVAMSPYSAKSMETYVRRIKSARTSFYSVPTVFFVPGKESGDDPLFYEVNDRADHIGENQGCNQGERMLRTL